MLEVVERQRKKYVEDILASMSNDIEEMYLKVQVVSVRAEGDVRHLTRKDHHEQLSILLENKHLQSQTPDSQGGRRFETLFFRADFFNLL